MYGLSPVPFAVASVSYVGGEPLEGCVAFFTGNGR